MTLFLSTAWALIAAAGLGANPANNVTGDYLEARTADVFTGPCFSNSEVFLTGHQAVIAWKVNKGTWNGVDVSGLTVAAAIVGTTTFDRDAPESARSIVIVDQSASPSQREALVAMARELAGPRMKNVLEVRTSPLAMTLETHGLASDGSKAPLDHHALIKTPHASFWAPGLAEIHTRPLTSDDHFCGNEIVEYPPLSAGVAAQPAYTLSHAFRGKGLGTNWDDHNCRSAFVGNFAR
jgi:hypothetical protein